MFNSVKVSFEWQINQDVIFFMRESSTFYTFLVEEYCWTHGWSIFECGITSLNFYDLSFFSTAFCAIYEKIEWGEGKIKIRWSVSQWMFVEKKNIGECY